MFDITCSETDIRPGLLMWENRKQGGIETIISCEKNRKNFNQP